RYDQRRLRVAVAGPVLVAKLVLLGFFPHLIGRSPPPRGVPFPGRLGVDRPVLGLHVDFDGQHGRRLRRRELPYLALRQRTVVEEYLDLAHRGTDIGTAGRRYQGIDEHHGGRRVLLGGLDGVGVRDRDDEPGDAGTVGLPQERTNSLLDLV